ncbi:MAG: ester cyclase [Thermomicrobiales bacterium]|nr:ester cyclase [Thermomicrobiales bacterium]
MRRIPILVLTASLCLVMASRLGAGAQEVSPAATPLGCPATTPEQNEDLVRRYWEVVYNEKRPERAADFLAEDFVRRNTVRPQDNAPGTDDDVARARENLTDFPDLHITIEDVVAAEDEVVVRLIWSGTQDDDMEAWGAPATGRRASYDLVAIYRIACGRLAEQWVVADYLTMLRQLGIVTDEELATAATPMMATPVP